MTQSRIVKLQAYPPIGALNKDALDRFSILLSQTYNLCRDMPELNQLKNPCEIMKMIIDSRVGVFGAMINYITANI